jgi:hypothetical protein
VIDLRSIGGVSVVEKSAYDSSGDTVDIIKPRRQVTAALEIA